MAAKRQPSGAYTEADKKEDMKVLHGMGYAQELSRGMSKFSNFAISFSIICILSGGINSFAQATSSVGGAGAGIGWIVGCGVSAVFAVAMAQIASAYPTAGGLYHWGSILGNRFTGWVTAWLNLLGLITVMGAINIGTAFFFTGTFGPLIGMTGTPGEIVIFVGVITILQALINHLGIKLTALLTDWSGYIILGTTAVLIVACLIFAPTHEWSRLWTFTNYSGDAGGDVWPQSDSLIYLFALSLLLPIYTITGYDASAHTSEETYWAAHSVPRGIVHSVLWSSLAGWLWSAAIVIAIPDLAEGAKQGWTVFFSTMSAIMPNWLVQLLYLFILIAQFLCGLATVTSASRMIFAFCSRRRPAVHLQMGVVGQSQISHPGGGDLDGRGARISLRLDGADRIDRRDQYLHDRCERDVDLPVPVVHRADCSRHLCHRHAEMADDGTVGHRHYAVSPVRRAVGALHGAHHLHRGAAAE